MPRARYITIVWTNVSQTTSRAGCLQPIPETVMSLMCPYIGRITGQRKQEEALWAARPTGRSFHRHPAIVAGDGLPIQQEP